MYLFVLAVFSQSGQKGDSAYRTRRLTFEEANIVSSYYVQDGNKAAVTGGIGTEKLTDISATFDMKFVKYDKLGRKHNFTAELGIDHYTSASSDKVDPQTISSASYADNRIYPSIQWTMEDARKGRSVGAGFTFSNEFDYNSYGFNVNFTKKTKDRNGEFSAKLQAYLDQLSLIYPIELRSGGSSESGIQGHAGRDTYSGSFSWSQVINSQLQLMLEAELVYQTGYLGLPFHRVYFTDGSVHVENLPSKRVKLPVGIRANYFIGDKFIVRSWYRIYHDDWGINSNAATIETVFKATPFFSITPYYRFYQQTAAEYFAPYREHSGVDPYYSSNYSYAKFSSHFFGAGFRIAPPQGVFNIQRVNSLELRYGHYEKMTDLNANIISMHIGFR